MADWQRLAGGQEVGVSDILSGAETAHLSLEEEPVVRGNHVRYIAASPLVTK